MGKILVLYDSRTGNTKKMAELVAAGAQRVAGSDVRIVRVSDARKEDILWADGVAVGSPTHMGILSAEMKKFWDDLGDDLWGKIDGRIGCAFASAGGWGGGNELTCLSILLVMMNFGFLVFGLPDYAGKQLTLHYGAVLAGEPRAEAERNACELLGERLAQWVGVNAEGRKDLHPRRLPG